MGNGIAHAEVYSRRVRGDPNGNETTAAQDPARVRARDGNAGSRSTAHRYRQKAGAVQIRNDLLATIDLICPSSSGSQTKLTATVSMRGIKLAFDDISPAGGTMMFHEMERMERRNRLRKIMRAAVAKTMAPVPAVRRIVLDGKQGPQS